MQSAMSLPTWVEISLSHLRENWKTVRHAVPSDCGIVVVLKADAYGHGAIECCRALQGCGAEWFGVSTPAEGRRLRDVCRQGKIVVLSYFAKQDCTDILDYDLIPQIWEPRQAEILEAACRNRRRTHKLPVHVEVDTGMARQGLRSAAALEVLLKHIRESDFLELEGVMTHFSAPESLEPDNTIRQIDQLSAILQPLLRRRIKVGFIHAGNSATAFVPKHLSALQELAKKCGASLMIRSGMALYGHRPRFFPSGLIEVPALLPVLSLRSRVIAMCDIEVGASAGYEMAFRALRPTRLALIPVGYADGLSRLLSCRGVALVKDRRASYAGLVSMDLTLLDVTEIPGVSVGDQVTLLGEQEGECVSAYDIADAIGTIPDEVSTAISTRIPRIICD